MFTAMGKTDPQVRIENLERMMEKFIAKEIGEDVVEGG